MEARGVRFRRLLEILFADTGLRYTASPEVRDLRLTLSLRGVHLRTALRLVTDKMREQTPALVGGTEGDAWSSRLLSE